MHTGYRWTALDDDRVRQYIEQLQRDMIMDACKVFLAKMEPIERVEFMKNLHANYCVYCGNEEDRPYSCTCERDD